MAFTKKTWKDRLTAFPSRRRLVKEDGTSELVTVSREEGEISQEGDAFSAANMNDLENRIANALNSVTISVDTTLTQSGMAADAKAVGDAIADIQSTSGGIKYVGGETDEIQLLGDDGQWYKYDNGGLTKKYLIKSGSVNSQLVGSISRTNWYVYSTSYPVSSGQPVFTSTGFVITASGGTVGTMGVGGTEYAVDLTNVSKICANINTSTNGGKLQVCKASKILYYDSSYTSSAVVARKDFAKTENYVELNVSSLSGVHYLAITTAGSAGSVDVGDWWLE